MEREREREREEGGGGERGTCLTDKALLILFLLSLPK